MSFFFWFYCTSHWMIKISLLTYIFINIQEPMRKNIYNNNWSVYQRSDYNFLMSLLFQGFNSRPDSTKFDKTHHFDTTFLELSLPKLEYMTLSFNMFNLLFVNRFLSHIRITNDLILNLLHRFSNKLPFLCSTQG